MKCSYIAAFAARGLALSSNAPDVQFFDLATSSASAVLTSAPDQKLVLADRGSALAKLLITGMFHGGDDRSIEDRLAKNIAEVRDNRTRNTGAVPTLIVTVEWEEEINITGKTIDIGGASVLLDGVDKVLIRARAQPLVNRALTAIILATNSDPGVRKLVSTIYFTATDKRIIYPFALEGRADLVVARRLSDEAPQLVSRYFEALASENLAPVYRLLQLAVEQEGEPIAGFIAAWTALEIFTNKAFERYEKKWFQEATKNRGDVERRHVGRLREVMRDKYRLQDKFAVVSMMLDENNADYDLGVFSEVKKNRDELLHGGFDSRRQFKAEEAITLVRKYLKKHLEEVKS